MLGDFQPYLVLTLVPSYTKYSVSTVTNRRHWTPQNNHNLIALIYQVYDQRPKVEMNSLPLTQCKKFGGKVEIILTSLPLHPVYNLTYSGKGMTITILVCTCAVGIIVPLLSSNVEKNFLLYQNDFSKIHIHTHKNCYLKAELEQSFFRRDYILKPHLHSHALI